MIIKVTNSTLSYPTSQGTADNLSNTVEPNGAKLFFTISELFGDTSDTAQQLEMKILYSEYLDNFDDTDQSGLALNKMIEKINDGDIVIRVESMINDRGANGEIANKIIKFNTIDVETKDNKLVIQDKVKIDIETYNTAKESKMDGIIAVVKNKLITEFTNALNV
jgi:hypothetical protein